ncbi:MAG: lipopolysaccharide biosynthesis protein [Odoribacter sp.]|nr:lipopolysaccharide biosynthesis protein [Odoribacter sp.]
MSDDLLQQPSLKVRTARTLKWNAIDRVAAQVLYAITGIILARLLSQEDFGLVGAVLVFQAFASLLVDSGFSSALIQRKNPTQADYSTVLWFNMAVATAIYIVLFFSAPLIADCFQGDDRLVPLSRVMFLSFILNAASIVQVNRLMKRMDVKMVAVSNSLGLACGGVTGIALAINGFGAWAIVWQTITLSAVKTLVLWTSQRWLPSPVFSFKILRSYFNIGSRMMLTSFLNTLFLNIYSFFIGNRVGMASLGYYTQSDKWSKMGIMSLSQVLTSSFLPALSSVQDERDRFSHMSSKMNRFTSYLVFPAFIGLIAMATPIFHALFGSKWDPSIYLFQLLLVKGIFTVFIGYYNNVLLALGHAKSIMWMEVLRDTIALIALAITLPYIALTRTYDIVWGISILLYGQIAASFVTWVASLIILSRYCKRPLLHYLTDMTPYAALSLIAGILMAFSGSLIVNPYISIVVELTILAVLYLGVGYLGGSTVQKEVLSYMFKTQRRGVR